MTKFPIKNFQLKTSIGLHLTLNTLTVQIMEYMENNMLYILHEVVCIMVLVSCVIFCVF